jgi:hypothetical protein
MSLPVPGASRIVAQNREDTAIRPGPWDPIMGYRATQIPRWLTPRRARIAGWICLVLAFLPYYSHRT